MSLLLFALGLAGLVAGLAALFGIPGDTGGAFGGPFMIVGAIFVAAAAIIEELALFRRQWKRGRDQGVAE